MTITMYTCEDTPETALAKGAPAGANAAEIHASVAGLENAIGGCFGFLSVFQICAQVDVANLSATIELKAFGNTIASGTISAAHPCLAINVGKTIAGVGVEANLNVCLDISGRAITVDGKACVKYFIGKKCATLSKHTIIHF